MSENEREPLVLTEEEFLCQADGPDPFCNQHFDDYIADIDSKPDPSTVDVIRPPYYAIAESSDSVLLLYRAAETNQWETVGYYNGPGAVCIQDEHQGQGLGAELILQTAMLRGHPPTEDLDEQMFSEAGYRAHQAAWRLGVDRGWIVETAPGNKMAP